MSVEYSIINIESEISGTQNETDDLNVFFEVQNGSGTGNVQLVQIDRASAEDDDEWSEGSENLRKRLLDYMNARGKDHVTLMKSEYD